MHIISSVVIAPSHKVVSTELLHHDCTTLDFPITLCHTCFDVLHPQLYRRRVKVSINAALSRLLAATIVSHRFTRLASLEHMELTNTFAGDSVMSANSSDNDVWHVDKDCMKMQKAAEREKKTPYFLYGSLMDPSTLKRVLRLQERPQLKPASIVGYHVKMWGPYPALQSGPPGSIVRGMMWEVEGTKRKDRLADYETSNYREWDCVIDMGDGSSVWGTTFIWDGDTRELKEGTFDLKDWQMNQLDHS